MMVRLVRLRISLLIVALILLRNYNSGNTNLGRAAQGLAAELAGIERWLAHVRDPGATRRPSLPLDSGP